MSFYMPSFTKVHISSHQNMPSFKGSSTDNSHIFPHKPCLLSKTLPRKIHTSSHPERAYLHKGSHHLTQSMSFQYLFSTDSAFILSPKTCLFACLLSQGITYPLTKPMPFFNGSSTQNSIHTFAHTNHAFFQRLFHRQLTYLPTQTMPSFKDSSTENSHILSPKTCLFTDLIQ